MFRFKKKVQDKEYFNSLAFRVNNESSEVAEPMTIAKYRLENNANDYNHEKGLSSLKDHSVKVQNQWINPLQSINSGYGTSQLSFYHYQNVNYYECYALAQDPLMNKVFNILSKTPFAQGGEVADLSDDEKEELHKIELKWHIWDVIRNAVRSNYVSGGCLLYLDFGEDENLEEPLDLKKVNLKKFRGFIHIDPINTVAVQVNTSEPAKKDYMIPSMWYVVGLGNVHASRFIKFEDNIPELVMRPMTMYFGMPLTLLIKQDIANSNLASQGLANLVNRFRNLYLKTDSQNFIGEGAQNFRERLETMSLFQDNTSIYPIKDTEDIFQLTTSLQGMAENCEFFYQVLASKTDITLSILLGKGAEGLSGTLEGERKNFYDRIRTIQESNKRNILLILGIIYGIEKGGKFVEFSDYVFRPLEQPTEKENAENIKGYIDMANALVELGVSNDKALDWLKSHKELGMQSLEIDSDTEGLGEYDDLDVSTQNSN